MIDQSVQSLSGGERARLSLLHLIFERHNTLLLDEPTEGIQPNIVQEIEATIKRLNQEVGLTLVLTEQHIRVAKELAHEFIIMDRGRIEERGPIAELTEELVHKHLTI